MWLTDWRALLPLPEERKDFWRKIGHILGNWGSRQIARGETIWQGICLNSSMSIYSQYLKHLGCAQHRNPNINNSCHQNIIFDMRRKMRLRKDCVRRMPFLIWCLFGSGRTSCEWMSCYWYTFACQRHNADLHPRGMIPAQKADFLNLQNGFLKIRLMLNLPTIQSKYQLFISIIFNVKPLKVWLCTNHTRPLCFLLAPPSSQNYPSRIFSVVDDDAL